MQELATLVALNGLAITILIVAAAETKKEAKQQLKETIEKYDKELADIKSDINKNKEREEAFRKDVKETISKEFLAMAYRGIKLEYLGGKKK